MVTRPRGRGSGLEGRTEAQSLLDHTPALVLVLSRPSKYFRNKRNNARMCFFFERYNAFV